MPRPFRRITEPPDTGQTSLRKTHDVYAVEGELAGKQFQTDTGQKDELHHLLPSLGEWDLSELTAPGLSIALVAVD
jgi:hypothetical protein